MATFSDWLWNVGGGTRLWCEKMVKGIWIATAMSKINWSWVGGCQLLRKCWSLPANWRVLDRIVVSMPIAINAGWTLTGTIWLCTSRDLVSIWGLGAWFRWSLLDSTSDKLAFKVSLLLKLLALNDTDLPPPLPWDGGPPQKSWWAVLVSCQKTSFLVETEPLKEAGRGLEDPYWWVDISVVDLQILVAAGRALWELFPKQTILGLIGYIWMLSCIALETQIVEQRINFEV